MHRTELIQKLFEKENYNTYLEIGCQKGYSFLPVKAEIKVAVDPEFKIELRRKIKWILKYPRNIFNKYFEETSDSFFEKRKEFIKNLGGIDVVLVDGLHTFEAALKDVINSLKYLKSNGVIIVHDCLPPNKAAALPTKQFPSKEEQEIEGWQNIWCGDVWKSIIYLREGLKDEIDVCVLNSDLGLGIIKLIDESARNHIIESELFNEIDKLDYNYLMRDVNNLLNLKNPEFVNYFLKDINFNT